ncbi:MAG: TRAP transporter large permease subunit, partial [Alphaproteobacteria bacterium]|nr:TRAP transporter large permease subunit [Alphaproteobacteria bacterium]
IPMVIYAAVVQESVIDLFMAGVVPGLLLTAMFMAWVSVRLMIEPRLVPARGERPDGRAILEALWNGVPIILLIMAILGGMYFGVVTPTEAAAFGCVIAFGIALLYREIDWGGMKAALRNSVVTNAVVMFIIINAQILTYALSASGVGRGVSHALAALGLAPLAFYCMLFVLYAVLGMFIDGISIMLLTVPLLYTSILASGLNGVLFGVILVVLIELGQLTPPMGLNLFAIQSISGGASLARIAWSSLPYAVLIALLCFLLYFFPAIALWLPAAIKG